MKKNIVIIDDTNVFLKKANLRLKMFLGTNALADEYEIILVGKDNITAYREIPSMDIALVDFNYMIPDEDIDGLIICQEIAAKHSGVKMAMITASEDAKKEIDIYNFNAENKNKITLIDRGFTSIEEFIMSHVNKEVCA